MKSVTEWLDTTAKRMPERTALVDASGSVTYREYREKAQSIARHIHEMGLNQKPIAVFLEKSLKIPVSFLGIAYSGCFYTPIDPDMPSQRIGLILQNLQPSLVITEKHLRDEFAKSGYPGPYLYYEECIPETNDAQILQTINYSSDNLLYVLYTSGSTGIPKGVSILHRSVLNYIDWVSETFHITEEDSFGNQAPFYFDNSILDLYTSIKTGACMYIIPTMFFSQPVLLLQYLKEHKITTIFWVPSALIVVARLRAFKSVSLDGIVKRVLFCGEVMPNKHLNAWRKALPHAEYANLYGPTEITDVCCWYTVNRTFSDDEPLPIGKAISNVDVFLLDNENKRANEGEISVRGICLSPGYYRDEERSSRVFVPNPENPSEIIYRTGDLGKYNEFGELMYLGRKDFQIKFHGRRVELGEIETVATSVEGVANCCSLFDEKQEKIVLFLEKGVDEQLIKEKLSQRLPKYMIPSKIVIIEEIPINCNGKIDRVKLKELL